MATQIVKCPVCDRDIEEKTWYEEDHRWIEEQEAHCPTKHWSREYSYGDYRESVGEQDWGWHYDTEPVKREDIETEIKAAITRLRKEFLDA